MPLAEAAFLVAVGSMWIAGLACLAIVLYRDVRRAIRHRRVRRERDAVDRRSSAPPLVVSDRRRPVSPLRAVSTVRPDQFRDSDLARAFRIRLEERGYQLDELQIVRKLDL